MRVAEVSGVFAILLLFSSPALASFVYYVPEEYRSISNIWNFTITQEELYKPFRNITYNFTVEKGIVNVSLPIKIPENYYLERIGVVVVYPYKGNYSDVYVGVPFWNGRVEVITDNGTYKLKCFTEESIRNGIWEKACNYIYYGDKELYELKIEKNATLKIAGKIENVNAVNLTVFFIPKDFAESKIVTPTTYGGGIIRRRVELGKIFGYFTLGKIDTYRGEKVLSLYSECPFEVDGKSAYEVKVYTGENEKKLYFHDFSPGHLPLEGELRIDKRCEVERAYFTPGIAFVNREIFKIKPTSVELNLSLKPWDEVNYYVEIYKNKSDVSLLSFYFPSDEKGVYRNGGRVWIEDNKVCAMIEHPEFGKLKKCSQLNGWTGKHYLKLLIALERSDNGKRFLNVYQYETFYESDIKDKLLSIEVDLPIAIKHLTNGAFILGAKFEAKRSLNYYVCPISFGLIEEVKLLKVVIALLVFYSGLLTVLIWRCKR